MKVACTICSKHKNESKELLPARVRYASPHIAATEKMAEESKLPFFILSGKYGLISGEEKIPYYDYYLEESAVDALVPLIQKQIKERGITEIDFYTEAKPSWAPYESALQKSSKLEGVVLNVQKLI